MFEPGEAIFNEGELGRTMYVLREGEVEVTRQATSGHKVPIVRLGPGETFGEMTLVELQPRSATVVGEAAVRTYSLTNLDLYNLYREDNYAYVIILQNICRMLSRRLRKADSRIVEFLDALAARQPRAGQAPQARPGWRRRSADVHRAHSAGRHRAPKRARRDDRRLASSAASTPQDYKLGESIACDGVLPHRRRAPGQRLPRRRPRPRRCAAPLSAAGAPAPGSTWSGRCAWVIGSAATWCRATSTPSPACSRPAPTAAPGCWRSRLPPALAPCFVEKGSVAVDGVSLTVNELLADRFRVALIPETCERTTLRSKGVGEKVNLEADLFGKYVARLHGLRQGLTEEELKAKGF